MARRKVIFLSNHYYHVYNRGVHQNNIFLNDADFKFLLKYIKREAKRCGITVVVYCLMNNHYHFILRQDGDIAISEFMQAVFNIYTKAFNAKYKLSGTLFEGPYKAIHVDQNPYLLQLCRYIHRNPLEAGIVVKPEQWDYSNYAEFIGKRNGSLVDREFVKMNFGSPENYEDFVLNYIPPEKTQKELRHYLFWD
ncbi:MAG: transposase [Anaerolineales bacterium]|nr:transposase [Anaerolineales bacterium]